MREFWKKQCTQTTTINQVPAPIVEQLDAIWARLGFQEPQLQERLTQAEAYIDDLHKRFINEERGLEDEFINSIKELERSISELNVELGKPVYHYQGPDILIPKEKILKEEYGKLKHQKDQRMIELMNLKQEEGELCSKMGQTAAYVSSEKIPTAADLNLIKDNIKRLKLLKDQRWQEFKQLKEELTDNHRVLHEHVHDTFLQNMIVEEADSFAALNNDNLEEMRVSNNRWKEERNRRQAKKTQLEDKISAVSRRLQKSDEFVAKLMKSELSTDWLLTLEENLAHLEDEKKTKLKGIILNMREELRNIWDKLYYSQEERDRFLQYYIDDFTEENCECHEQEIEKLNGYYNQHSNMFAGVEKWQNQFDEYLAMKDREKDPNRYKNNRGKSSLELQKELKRMNVLKRKLPKLEEELIGDIEEWQIEHDKPFLVDGVPFIEYIESRWSEIQQGKQKEKFERHRKKKEQLAVDMVYGTRTPTKRALHSSNRDLTKRSRLEGSVMSSIAVSKLSEIPAFKGPTTPSRKENQTPSFASRKLRRRSKSASNLINPLSTVKSTIGSRLGNIFRTPQPQKKSSRIPKPAATERIKRTGQRILRTVEEKEDDKLLTSLEDVDNFEYGPTSAKSAPNRFLDEEEPMSYEDFGASLKRSKNPRSSAIGVMQFTTGGRYNEL